MTKDTRILMTICGCSLLVSFVGLAFDGYALTVTVTDGFVTVQAGVGALDPKINFVEIAPVGTVIDAPTNARVQAAAVQATHDTAKPKAKTPPTVKRNVWGTYVDELVSYTVKKPRKSPTRFYAHANHLYSVVAITSATGSVVERWSYNAYGVPTIKNSANATIATAIVDTLHFIKSCVSVFCVFWATGTQPGAVLPLGPL